MNTEKQVEKLRSDAASTDDVIDLRRIEHALILLSAWEVAADVRRKLQDVEMRHCVDALPHGKAVKL